MARGPANMVSRDHTDGLIETARTELPAVAEAEHIAARERNVDELLRSEHQFRALCQHAPVGIFLTNETGQTLYVNQRWCEITGASAQESIGTGWANAIHPDDRARILEQWQQESALRRPVSTEYRFLTPSGTTVWVHGSAAPIFDQQGEFGGYVGTLLDITEEKSAEQALRDSEQRYRTVVEVQTDLIVRWHGEGVRTFANDAYCRYFGQPRRQVLGTSLFDLIHPDDLEAVRERIARLSPDDPVSSGEHRVLRSEGTIGWQQWIDRALFDEHGQVLEYQSVGRDVTQLRQTEDALREKQLQLAHVGRLATMGQVVAGIAHEVNQPLHAATTFAAAARNALESGRDDAVAKAIDWATRISDEITRAGSIIRRLRNFTKPSAVSFAPLVINQVIEEAIELVAFEARRKAVVVETDFAEDLGTVSGDRIQIQQVVVNLLTNAFEALAGMDDCPRRVQIFTCREGSEVCVAVADNGPGIDCGTGWGAVERIFEPFYTTRQEGMGMGLALSKSMVEAHRGKIRVARNDSGGATVSFTLPLD